MYFHLLIFFKILTRWYKAHVWQIILFECLVEWSSGLVHFIFVHGEVIDWSSLLIFTLNDSIWFDNWCSLVVNIVFSSPCPVKQTVPSHLTPAGHKTEWQGLLSVNSSLTTCHCLCHSRSSGSWSCSWSPGRLHLDSLCGLCRSVSRAEWRDPKLTRRSLDTRSW